MQSAGSEEDSLQLTLTPSASRHPTALQAGRHRAEHEKRERAQAYFPVVMCSASHPCSKQSLALWLGCVRMCALRA